MEKLWSKTNIGIMVLPHRLAMAPMTRSRSQEDGTPGFYTDKHIKGWKKVTVQCMKQVVICISN
ncbi:hypothetical protein NST83_03090 [Paenibacillus sp. FSL R10-2782]|uniref:hypothetical protein n=1 Tax=Paenibacillus sp. FSL R10-2782 TaxID=2954661 RepID=UPI003158E4DA